MELLSFARLPRETRMFARLGEENVDVIAKIPFAVLYRSVS